MAPRAGRPRVTRTPQRGAGDPARGHARGPSALGSAGCGQRLAWRVSAGSRWTGCVSEPSRRHGRDRRVPAKGVGQITFLHKDQFRKLWKTRFRLRWRRGRLQTAGVSPRPRCCSRAIAHGEARRAGGRPLAAGLPAALFGPHVPGKWERDVGRAAEARAQDGTCRVARAQGRPGRSRGLWAHRTPSLGPGEGREPQGREPPCRQDQASQTGQPPRPSWEPGRDRPARQACLRPEETYLTQELGGALLVLRPWRWRPHPRSLSRLPPAPGPDSGSRSGPAGGGRAGARGEGCASEPSHPWCPRSHGRSGGSEEGPGCPDRPQLGGR